MSHRRKTPDTLQLTPGPSGIHPDVRGAVARQTLNHTHPDFLEECHQVQQLLRVLMGTENKHTGALTCSGTGGNEAGVMNFVHPGDRALYVNSGFFSGRIGDMISRRYPKEIIEMNTEFGQTVDPNRFEETIARYGEAGISAAFVAQIETSAGTEIPRADLVRLGTIATRYRVMLCVDAVCALGGAPVCADAWQAAYVSACSQKGVNAPPGTAPFTVSPLAMERIQERRRQGCPPGSLYLDLESNMRYWNEGIYHATPGVQNIYALGKALQMTMDRANGNLPHMFNQHAINQRALEAGLEEIGFTNPVEPAKRASVVSVIETPEGTDARAIRQKLLGVKEVRGRQIGGVEFAAGKRDPAREMRVALLGLWSNKETVLDACDAMGQVTGTHDRAVQAAAGYFADHQQPDSGDMRMRDKGMEPDGAASGI
ncbi:MAG TPA: hypothetical protein DEB30_01660 [Candidatus Peribacter riflensis]|uniref:Alanine-glyoxylate transaminase / serine-glyoxylate transaminase / serine-pyruvate transaminase n=1 Tax=Candidatus Peribacter riflensis TaxID=1735162 RepID=A0A0S1SKK4_9BACT|nr:MAG: alanine-glyoxylate transaminase / serine-glyoxylate transaminase / serine-pyruvate transaminase [Candidatus Peribacter riflensis]ALM11507.1 MAG: class V aminotransferase [Candidatus Peribacter riflensis]ALM12609.1 MAG: alanine-glyoxylate transaminase / serine-glyoxylate transaminase / serine-pyruvate transaminase [Candidatus Peribacter riflensis]ALM13710.1 MAG: alanine-glyoxylate transaminase / serine-glyoxylate transaminase / serine-pyruvate transaminase [Candidatus Peribacter riflensis